MLHNIVFTDNIFILSRTLGLISQSLHLVFAEEVFSKKFELDILFCGETIKKIFEKLNSQEHLHDYLDTMKCLYSCSSRFVQILANLESENRGIFESDPEKISKLRIEHEEIRLNISKKVRNTNVDAEIINIVSDMELTELLDFGNPVSTRN
ncbi:MAG: hypothetical protein P1P64_06645 [Treponemataceae bacterium]